MIFLLTKNPYALQYSSKGKGQPNIELFDVKIFEISKLGVNSIIFANRVERYKGYDKMYMIDALHRSKLNLIDSLKANNGLLIKNILYLDNNVRYTRSDDLALNSNSIKYDIKNKILSGDQPFELSIKNMLTKGNSFTYLMQKGIIQAQKIKTVIRMEQ